jgi:hypothetical protein
MQARKYKKNKLQQYYLINPQHNGSKNTPRDTTNPPKLLFYYKREDFPNGTKNHERKWERMRKKGERDGITFGII